MLMRRPKVRHHMPQLSCNTSASTGFLIAICSCNMVKIQPVVHARSPHTANEPKANLAVKRIQALSRQPAYHIKAQKHAQGNRACSMAFFSHSHMQFESSRGLRAYLSSCTSDHQYCFSWPACSYWLVLRSLVKPLQRQHLMLRWATTLALLVCPPS